MFIEISYTSLNPYLKNNMMSTISLALPSIMATPRLLINKYCNIFIVSALLLSLETFAQNSPDGFLPVSVIQWKATVKNTDVELSWMTTVEKNLNTFIIERSSTGIDYQEVTTLPAAGNTDVLQKYFYADKLHSNANNVLYYRLKSRDLSGNVKQSDVLIVRSAKTQLNKSISLYPNPAINDLTVNLPVNWHNQKVAFDLYNANGTIVKHVVNNRATPAESMQLHSLPPGLYTLKASANAESTTTQFIKR